MKHLAVLIALALFAGAAHAETTRSYRTPAPLIDASACRVDVACEPALEGAPNSQPAARVWSVRTIGAPPEEGYVQASPIAIIADVDVDAPDYDERSDRPRRPYLRRDSN